MYVHEHLLYLELYKLHTAGFSLFPKVCKQEAQNCLLLNKVNPHNPAFGNDRNPETGMSRNSVSPHYNQEAGGNAMCV